MAKKDGNWHTAVSKKKKLVKYKKVIKEIEGRGLDKKRDLSDIKDQIDFCKDMVDKIEGNEGYHYLSDLKDKLKDAIKVMKKYYTFIKDTNQSIIDLHDTLEEEVKTLQSDLDSAVEAYKDEHDLADDLALDNELFWIF